MSYLEPLFWLALLKIIWINVLLSGDNAVVIAMACRSLPDRMRRTGMVLGAAVAVGMRIVFTAIIAVLLGLPWLRVIGALALMYIAVDLVVPEAEGEEGGVTAHDSLWRAVGTIAVADLVMSLDNVVAIAAVADGNWVLIIIGLVISIPMIIAGAALIMNLLSRFPFLVWAGAGLLGWVAGEMFLSDIKVVEFLGEASVHSLEYVAAAAGAALVLLIGWTMTRLRRPAHPHA
ncbi:YjbE family integral membrane protein [Angulomicrobium tetraedrale]|uniref:YjbE family integral membrane protein n=1 Tax=Ancylobacter tetraedralis TaxID=217068 RepID=A0A839Z3T1_9HYPH|nr:TerC family protein [Ancylobacter tetraedralis]MBB3770292.1 YjbE family integral membrane protein [Ancylobacter tetraedralis]